MTKWVKILGVIGIVLIAGAVTVAVLVTQYDYNKLKPTIAKLAKDATGRDLAINGDLKLAVSLSPTLTVSDVTFSNAPWGEKGDMVRLDQLAAKVDLLALLQGRVDIDYLVLDGLKVVLQTDGKGGANWEFTAPGAPKKAGEAVPGEAVPSAGDSDLKLAPSARDIRLRDIDVTYIDGATGKHLRLLLQRADFKADSFTAPMHATLLAAYQGVAVDASVDMGSLSHLVGSGGGAFPVTMKITAPGLSIGLDGSVEQPQAGMTVNAAFDMAVSDATTLAKLAGADLPNLNGLKVNMKIAGGGEQYAFNALDARVAGSDLGGDLTVNLAGPRPRVSGKLTAKVLDLDQILGIDAPQPQSGLRSSGPKVATVQPQGDAPRLFSADPLPLDALKAVDVDLGVLAGRIRVANLDLDAVKVGVKLNGGKLNVKPLSLSVEDGAIEGAVTFNAAAKTPALKITTTLTGLDIGRVLKTLGMGDVLSLGLNGKVKLASAGASVHKLMAGMNGSVRVSGRDGSINDTTITGLISGVGNELPWLQQEDAGRITCMVADFPVKSGVATAQTVLLDTPDFAVAVTGNIDLGGERLHLTVVPKAKTASLASFAVPVRIKGALSMPYIDIDPGDAVVGTVENIFKVPGSLLGTVLGVDQQQNGAAPADDPCVQALGGGKTGAKPATSTAPPPPNKPRKPLKPVEELGKALEGLFGK